MTVIWPTSRKCEQGKKKGRTPDYRIGNRPHTAKFKVVHNVMYIYLLRRPTLSNLQDEIAGQDGVRKWTFCGESNYSFLHSQLSLSVKYLWGIVKQIQHAWFISRSSENSWSLGVGCVRLLPSASRLEVASRIQHLGTSNFYYFPHIPCCICIICDMHQSRKKNFSECNNLPQYARPPKWWLQPHTVLQGGQNFVEFCYIFVYCSMRMTFSTLPGRTGRGEHSHIGVILVCATLMSPFSCSSSAPETHLFTPQVRATVL